MNCPNCNKEISDEEDVAELKDRLMAIQQKLAKLDDDFFANRFDRPVKMLTNATLQVRQILSNVSCSLLSSSYNTKELPEEIEE